MISRKKENLARAVGSLERALGSPITEDRDLAGIVKCFKMSFELAWDFLKALLSEQGQEFQGPRDVIRT